jgi:Haemolysin-type calcium binding protein related domain
VRYSLVKATAESWVMSCFDSNDYMLGLSEQLLSTMYGVEYIDFADGTSWNRAAILDALA